MLQHTRTALLQGVCMGQAVRGCAPSGDAAPPGQHAATMQHCFGMRCAALAMHPEPPSKPCGSLVGRCLLMNIDVMDCFIPRCCHVASSACIDHNGQGAMTTAAVTQHSPGSNCSKKEHSASHQGCFILPTGGTRPNNRLLLTRSTLRTFSGLRNRSNRYRATAGRLSNKSIMRKRGIASLILQSSLTACALKLSQFACCTHARRNIPCTQAVQQLELLHEAQGHHRAHT